MNWRWIRKEIELNRRATTHSYCTGVNRSLYSSSLQNRTCYLYCNKKINYVTIEYNPSLFRRAIINLSGHNGLMIITVYEWRQPRGNPGNFPKGRRYCIMELNKHGYCKTPLQCIYYRVQAARARRAIFLWYGWQTSNWLIWW